MTEKERPQLDYARQSPWHQRRSARRVLMLCFALLVLGAGLRWGGQVLGRLKANYYFSRCMQHRAPDGTVSWEVGRSGPHAGHVHEWSKFYAEWSNTGMRTYATLFVHERRSRSGNRRLVAVDFVSRVNRDLTVQSRVFQPPVGLAPAQLKNALARVLIMPDEPGTFRLLEGRPDPTDSSHFTIVFETSMARGVIDGWLKDDETVILEHRAVSGNPVTSPARSSPASSR